MESAGEVLQHGTVGGAAGSGFRGLNEEIERGRFRVGRRGSSSNCQALKLADRITNYQVLQLDSHICRFYAYALIATYVSDWNERALTTDAGSVRYDAARVPFVE